jgi:SAM-dependent methyltransferase
LGHSNEVCVKRGHMLVLLTTAALSVVPYWRDPRIHNMGNVGVMGGFHAAIAPLATRLIDVAAYNGKDVRRLARQRAMVAKDLDHGVVVLDLCCGVGSSTPAGGTGVDASSQMIAMAELRHRSRSSTYHVGNAETWGSPASASMVQVMFALHEMPRHGRHAVLGNAVRVAQDCVLVLDIDPSYAPSSMMRTGEPFLDDYLCHIEQDIFHIAAKHGCDARAWNVAPTLRAWLLG